MWVSLYPQKTIAIMPHQRSSFLQADGNYYKDPEKGKMTTISYLGVRRPNGYIYNAI